MSSIRSTARLVVISVCFSCVLIAQGEERSHQAEVFRETVIRHFRASYKLEEDSLICRSQVVGLQNYLRRTRSPYLSYFTGVLPRVSTDRSRLAVIYFQGNGAQLLDQVAEESGGFGPIAHLCRRSEGVLLIKEAIKKGKPDILKEAIAKETKEIAATAAGDKSGKRAKPARIYSVAELVEAVLVLADSSKSRPSLKQPVNASHAEN